MNDKVTSIHAATNERTRQEWVDDLLERLNEQRHLMPFVVDMLHAALDVVIDRTPDSLGIIGLDAQLTDHGTVQRLNFFEWYNQMEVDRAYWVRVKRGPEEYVEKVRTDRPFLQVNKTDYTNEQWLALPVEVPEDISGWMNDILDVNEQLLQATDETSMGPLMMLPLILPTMIAPRKATKKLLPVQAGVDGTGEAYWWVEMDVGMAHFEVICWPNILQRNFEAFCQRNYVNRPE